MGFKIAVKKTVIPPPPGCGSYETLQDAIDNPSQEIEDFYQINIQLDIALGEFRAVQYNDLGNSGSQTITATVFNTDSYTPVRLYIVNSSGNTVDTFYNAAGYIDGYDANIPTSLPFYLVIENVGGGSCDTYEFELENAPALP